MWLEHDCWQAYYCIHWWMITSLPPGTRRRAGASFLGIACHSYHLCDSFPMHQVSSVQFFAITFVFAAPCGNHHRRQRWDRYSRERALSAAVAMGTTFTQILLVVHLTEFERLARLIDRFGNTHKKKHTYTQREPRKMIKLVAHLLLHSTNYFSPFYWDILPPVHSGRALLFCMTQQRTLAAFALHTVSKSLGNFVHLILVVCLFKAKHKHTKGANTTLKKARGSL